MDKKARVEQTIIALCCVVDCLTSLKRLNNQRAEAAIHALEQMSEAGNISVYSEEVRRQVQLLRDLGHEVIFVAIGEM